MSCHALSISSLVSIWFMILWKSIWTSICTCHLHNRRLVPANTFAIATSIALHSSALHNCYWVFWPIIFTNSVKIHPKFSTFSSRRSPQKIILCKWLFTPTIKPNGTEPCSSPLSIVDSWFCCHHALGCCKWTLDLPPPSPKRVLLFSSHHLLMLAANLATQIFQRHFREWHSLTKSL